LFEDEFSLSNTATISYNWAVRGKQPRIRSKQNRRERQTTFGSINIRTGQMVINFSDKGNYKSFKKHLKNILHTFKNAPKIILVLDNVRYHHAKLLKKFLEENKRLEILYLPPYSPDLNPIERVWWFMRKSITHNRFMETLSLRKVKFWQMFSHFQIPNEKLLTICAIKY
ncbi:MAG TPA: IS630 family transposase, partial [Bacteroidales bacterium]|nr:IS630 family transposase [Bacteroidales bacterium]